MLLDFCSLQLQGKKLKEQYPEIFYLWYLNNEHRVETSDFSSFFPKGFVILPSTWAIKDKKNDVSRLVFTFSPAMTPKILVAMLTPHCILTESALWLLTIRVIPQNALQHIPLLWHPQASEEDIQDINKETDDTGGPGRGHHRGQHAQDGGDPRCIHCAPWSQAGRGSEKTSI